MLIHNHQTPSGTIAEGADAYFRDTISIPHSLKVIWSTLPPEKVASRNDPTYSPDDCALIILNGGADCLVTMGSIKIISDSAATGSVDVALFQGQPDVVTVTATPIEADQGSVFTFSALLANGQKARERDVVSWSWRSEPLIVYKRL